MSGIVNMFYELYIRFMIWLGAAPPPGYEHFLTGEDQATLETEMVQDDPHEIHELPPWVDEVEPDFEPETLEAGPDETDSFAEPFVEDTTGTEAEPTEADEAWIADLIDMPEEEPILPPLDPIAEEPAPVAPPSEPVQPESGPSPPPEPQSEPIPEPETEQRRPLEKTEEISPPQSEEPTPTEPDLESTPDEAPIFDQDLETPTFEPQSTVEEIFQDEEDEGVTFNDEPSPTSTEAALLPPTRPVSPVLEPGMDFRYEVQRGDTLSAIARRYGITVKELVEANDIPNPNLIYPGQKLVIPGYMTPPPR